MTIFNSSSDSGVPVIDVAQRSTELRVSPELRVLEGRESAVVHPNHLSAAALDDGVSVLAWGGVNGVFTTRILADGSQPSPAVRRIANAHSPVVVATESASTFTIHAYRPFLSASLWSQGTLIALTESKMLGGPVFPISEQELRGWDGESNRFQLISTHAAPRWPRSVRYYGVKLDAAQTTGLWRWGPFTPGFSSGTGPMVNAFPSAGRREIAVATNDYVDAVIVRGRSGNLVIQVRQNVDCGANESADGCVAIPLALDTSFANYNELDVAAEIVGETMFVVFADRHGGSGVSRIRYQRFAVVVELGVPRLEAVDSAPVILYTGVEPYLLQPLSITPTNLFQGRRIGLVPTLSGVRVFGQFDPEGRNRELSFWNLPARGVASERTEFSVGAGMFQLALSQDLVVVQGEESGAIETWRTSGTRVAGLTTVETPESLLGVACGGQECSVAVSAARSRSFDLENALVQIDQRRSQVGQARMAPQVLTRILGISRRGTQDAQVIGEARTNADYPTARTPVSARATGEIAELGLREQLADSSPFVWSVSGSRFLVCSLERCASGDDDSLSTRTFPIDHGSVSSCATGSNGANAVVFRNGSVRIFEGSSFEPVHVSGDGVGFAPDTQIIGAGDGFILAGSIAGRLATVRLTRSGFGPVHTVASPHAFESIRLTQDGTGALLSVIERDLVGNQKLVAYRLDSGGRVRAPQIQIAHLDPLVWPRDSEQFEVAQNEAGHVYAYYRDSALTRRVVARTLTLPAIDVQ